MEAGSGLLGNFTINGVPVEQRLIPGGGSASGAGARFHVDVAYRSVQTDTLNVVGESPADAKGEAVAFTYVTNGVIERLVWDDQGGEVPLELDRC